MNARIHSGDRFNHVVFLDTTTPYAKRIAAMRSGIEETASGNRRVRIYLGFGAR